MKLSLPERGFLCIREFAYWKLYLHVGDQRLLGRSYAWLKRDSDCSRPQDLKQEERTELAETIIPEFFNGILRLWGPLQIDTVWGSSGRVHVHLIPKYSGAVLFNGRSFATPSHDRRRRVQAIALKQRDLEAIRVAVRDAMREWRAERKTDHAREGRNEK